MSTFNLSLSGLKRILSGIIVNAPPTGLTIGGLVTVVTVNDTTWTALPATALAKRNQINIQNASNTEIKLNYDPTIAGYVGMILGSGIEKGYAITSTIILYAKAQTGACDLNIEEIA